MKLNCDLGESFGIWKMSVDEAIMPLIDQANIACGFHGGDPVAIIHAIKLAKRYDVEIGAHPSYPDLQGFGRRSMTMGAEELIASIQYQVSALYGLAKCHQAQLCFVKPHGALYNDIIAKEDVRHAVMDAIAGFKAKQLPLVIQAHPNYQLFLREAEERNITLRFEAFADRCYTDSGSLVSRKKNNAVHDLERALQQSEQLIRKGSVTTESGKTLLLGADTLCVHGDSPAAINMATAIRTLISQTKATQ